MAKEETKKDEGTKAPPQPATALSAKGKKLYVQDLTVQEGKTRTHEIPVFNRDGELVKTVKVTCEFNSRTEVDYDIGLKFLKHKTFEVSMEDGTILKPLEVREGGLGGMQLKDNEIVAHYDELSLEALFKRAKVLPHSEEITPDTSKEQIIAFLKEAAKPAPAVNLDAEVAARMGSGDTMGGAVRGDSLEKLIPKFDGRAYPAGAVRAA